MPAAYFLIALVWARPASLSPTNTVPNLGDPLHLAWVMAWDAHQLVRRPWALFESNSFHPYPQSLVFSDHLLPEALMVGPVLWATGNAVLALNMATVLALTLSAWAMFLLVREVTGQAAAGLLAGAVYAYNSFTLHELPRVHVLNLQWWPLALLFLLRFAQAGRLRHAALTAGFLALQGLSGTYYLAYTLLALPLWLIGAYAGQRRRPARAEALRLAAALAVCALPVGLILLPYARALHAFAFEKSWSAGADLLAYVTPHRGHWLWSALPWPAVRAELPHFLGLFGGALMALGAVAAFRRGGDRRMRAAGLVALPTAIAGLLLSLGPLMVVGGAPVGRGPYALIYRWVPMARGMASPERAGVLVHFGQAVLVGLALAALLPRRPSTRLALMALLGGGLVLEHWQPPAPASAVPTGQSVPAVYAWLRQEADTPVVELPLYSDRLRRLFAAYLYFSTLHWRPVPFGRASFYPPAHEFLAWSMRGFPDRLSVALLDRLGIRRVVVHPHLWEASEREERLRALAAEPRLVLLRRFDDQPPARFATLGLGEELAYELSPAPAPEPPCRPASELARAGWTFASTGVNKPQRVADGDRRTAWFTAEPQRPGDRLEVELAQPQTLAALGVGLGYPYEEFGRELVVALLGEDGKWRRTPHDDSVAAHLATLEDLLERPREAAMVLRIAPQRARGVRLLSNLRQHDPALPRWAITELRLYAECH